MRILNAQFTSCQNIDGYRNIEKDGWVQTSSNGGVHSLSAEQLLSHIPPLLVGKERGHFTVRFESDIELKSNLFPR